MRWNERGGLPPFATIWPAEQLWFAHHRNNGSDSNALLHNNSSNLIISVATEGQYFENTFLSQYRSISWYSRAVLQFPSGQIMLVFPSSTILTCKCLAIQYLQISCLARCPIWGNSCINLLSQQTTQSYKVRRARRKIDNTLPSGRSGFASDFCVAGSCLRLSDLFCLGICAKSLSFSILNREIVCSRRAFFSLLSCNCLSRSLWRAQLLHSGNRNTGSLFRWRWTVMCSVEKSTKWDMAGFRIKLACTRW